MKGKLGVLVLKPARTKRTFPHLPVRYIETRKNSFRDPYTYYSEFKGEARSERLIPCQGAVRQHAWLALKKEGFLA